MAYTHTTLTALESDLAIKLGDTSKVFWTSTELKKYLYEAMRVYNAITGFHRTRTTFATVAGQSIYDLVSVVASERAPTVTIQGLFADIQYHCLVKTAGTTSWAGAAIFTTTEVESAISRAQRRFIADSACNLTNAAFAITAPLTNGRYDLSQDVVEVRRAAWKDALGKYTTVWETSEYELTSRSQSWLTTGTPDSYSVVASPPITLQLSPPPVADGTLDLVYVKAPAAITLAANDTLTVPDDLSYGVKWGALAELLSKSGPAADPQRASYCTMMYRMAVELARNCPVIVQAYVGSAPLLVTDMESFDGVAGGWQSKYGTVDTVGVAGLNLVGLRSTPRDATTTIGLDVVKNAPVTSANIQVPIDIVDMVLSYAYHLALFKCGGDEFEASTPDGLKLVEYAAKFNDRLRASSTLSDIIRSISTRSLALHPDMVEDQSGKRGAGAEMSESTERRRDSALQRSR